MDNQIVTKRDAYSKKFAACLTLFGCLFITAYTFLPDASKSTDAKMILGFVMGTLTSSAVNWAIGTSKSSSDKTDLLKGGSDV